MVSAEGSDVLTGEQVENEADGQCGSDPDTDPSHYADGPV